MTEQAGITDPVGHAVIEAINAGDRSAFFDLLAPGGTISRFETGQA